MKYFIDFEFIDDGITIDPISIGIVSQEGREFYAEFSECDLSKASDWVRENVLPFLRNEWYSKDVIAKAITKFVGDSPEFWGYYADYDWVVLCQIYGTMMDIPDGWPKWCRDVKQLMIDTGTLRLLEPEDEHYSLSDARWIREQYSKCLMKKMNT